MKKYFVFIVVSLLIKFCPCLCQQVIFNKVLLPLGSSGIAQDKNGYMWIAGGGGLYRYDGYSFKRYIHDPSDTNSLSATQLETLYIDREGMIWIATWINGLDRLDPETGKFTHFKHDPNDPGSLSHYKVRTILEDKEGVLWVGTHGGLDRYDPKTGKFQHYRYNENDPYSLSCDRVRALYEDKEGTLWVGTGSVWEGEGRETDEGGLNRFNKTTGKFTRYLHNPNDPKSLINNKVRAIFEDSKGNFWVGTAGDGLHRMNRKTGTFERYQYDPAHPDKLSRPPINQGAGYDHIGFITEDALGNLWIGTAANGLCRYDPEIQRTTYYNKDSSGFADQSGWSFCNSRDGILWICGLGGGLYRIDPYHKNVTHVLVPANVLAFSEDPVEGLWFGTGQGLFFQNSKTGNIKRFFYDPNNPNSLGNNSVYKLYRDDQGTLWIGSGTVLNRFNAHTNNFTRYFNDPKDTNTLSTGDVSGMVGEGDDYLWVCSGDRVDLMNKRTGTITHFKNDPKDTNSLGAIYTSGILKDGSGNLLVGTAGGTGLSYFNLTTRKFSHFLKGLDIFSLLLASDGTTWVGTDAGIFQTNDIYKGFKKFTYPGSDEIQNAFSIQEDNQKKIWLSTSLGIFRIDPVNNQTNFYGANYGVKGSNLTGAGFTARDGKIYFGDVNGYYVFSPAELTSNATPPQIILTGFSLGGTSVATGEKNTFTPSIENTKEISLKYNQNTFTIAFAAIHYSSPENNRHLYILENYDQAWHKAGVEKSASYFDVPPGHYIFHIKAASSDGVWAEKSISIIIYPPWWRTWWAYCMYGLAFVASAFYVHRFQKARVIKAERERSRVKELAQAKEIEKAYHQLEETHEALKATQKQLIHQEKMASLGELTAGIAHEIQNPLNFVNNFSEVNKEMIEELLSERSKVRSERDEELENAILNDIKENEEKINHHGKRADAIVKGMVQHSKTSTGIKEPTDINKLAGEYLRLSYHGMRAKDKEFNAEIRTEFDESIGKINIILQDIGRVLLNLFNNAFYAVNERCKAEGAGFKPIVTITTKRSSSLSFGEPVPTSREGRGEVRISVKDNGNGIPQDIIDKIFQPFFTTKPTGQGTGLGLSLAYDIVKAHGGEIKVQTKEGEGSEFVIALPA